MKQIARLLWKITDISKRCVRNIGSETLYIIILKIELQKYMVQKEVA